MDIYKEWLEFAEDDLQVAKVVVKALHYKAAVYHAQQCAEKSLKGYLVFNNEPIKKTHDLRVLLGLCYVLDADFFDIETEATELNELDTEFRYPSQTTLILDELFTLSIIDYAQKIFDFVQSKCI